MGMSSASACPSWGMHSFLLACDVPSNILQYPERAQHSFSSEDGSVLHATLPALEGLHKVWTTQMDSTKYFDFTDGLQAGLDKVSKYYEQTATSNAHIMAMCTFIGCV